jgi:hypothetical protein
MRHSSELTPIQILNHLRDMALSSEEGSDLYKDYSDTYQTMISDASVSGSDADKLINWWTDNSSFGEFNYDEEIEKLRAIIGDYAEE